MSETHFYDHVKGAVASLLTAREDNKITWAEAWALGGEVVQAGIHAWYALRDDSHFERLVEDCERVFDEYVAPLDIVLIPDAFEGVVDRIIKAQIRPTLAGLKDLVEG